MPTVESNEDYRKPDHDTFPGSGFDPKFTLGSSGYLFENVLVFDETLGRNVWMMKPFKRGPNHTCYPCYDKDL